MLLINVIAFQNIPSILGIDFMAKVKRSILTIFHLNCYITMSFCEASDQSIYSFISIRPWLQNTNVPLPVSLRLPHCCAWKTKFYQNFQTVKMKNPFLVGFHLEKKNQLHSPETCLDCIVVWYLMSLKPCQHEYWCSFHSRHFFNSHLSPTLLQSCLSDGNDGPIKIPNASFWANCSQFFWNPYCCNHHVTIRLRASKILDVLNAQRDQPPPSSNFFLDTTKMNFPFPLCKECFLMSVCK